MARITRWRRHGASLALLVGTVALCLLVGEVLVRKFTTVSPPLRVRDARIGEHYLEDFDEEVWSGEAGRMVRLRFNRWGFRGPDWPAKREGVVRIAVLGDSMVAALAVEENRTMAGRLDELMGPSVEVMNFGVSASSPAQALVLYRELVADLEPDVVVLAFFVGNDLSDSSRALDFYPRVYFEFDDDGQLVERARTSGRAQSSQWLNRNSRFYVWQKRLVNHALHAAAEGANLLPPGWWIFSNDPPPDVQIAWDVVEGVFAKWREATTKNGARFVVAVLPSGRQIHDDAFAPVRAAAGEDAARFAPEHADRHLEERCAAAGVECVFMRDAFIAQADDNNPLFFNKTGHFDERGHQVAAEILARTLTSTSAPTF